MVHILVVLSSPFSLISALCWLPHSFLFLCLVIYLIASASSWHMPQKFNSTFSLCASYLQFPLLITQFSPLSLCTGIIHRVLVSRVEGLTSPGQCFPKILSAWWRWKWKWWWGRELLLRAAAPEGLWVWWNRAVDLDSGSYISTSTVILESQSGYTI